MGPSFTTSDPSDLDFLLHAAVTVHAAWNHKYLFISVFSLQRLRYILSTLTNSREPFIKYYQVNIY